jgi:acyl-CoA hydrolase
VEVWARSVKQPKPKLTNEAYFTFVALNTEAHPIEVPAIEPVSVADKKHFKDAMIRKQKRRAET